MIDGMFLSGVEGLLRSTGLICDQSTEIFMETVVAFLCASVSL
jgi:hypothetical protein